MEKLIKKTFGGSEVAFEPLVADGNVMVNATQMAKIFGKRVNDFLRNESTRNFIYALSQNGNSRFENEFTPKGKYVKMVKGHSNVNGTWLHRLVAIKFAAWLDPYFEVWIYETIDEILFGYSREQDESIKRTVAIQAEMNRIEKKPDKSGDDFERYIKLNDEIVREKTRRANATRRRFREMYRHLKPAFAKN